MNNRTKRIRELRRKQLRARGSCAITFTKSEPYALCFYLYNMFENKSNNRIIEIFDEGIRCFFSCVDLLGMKERLNQVLKTEVKNLEEKQLLKPLEIEDSENTYLDSDVQYQYEQDRKIDRKIHRYETVDENVINLHRILSVTEKPVFSSIINTTVFKTGSDYRLSNTLTLSKKVEDAIFDISKTQFLVDQVNLSEDEARYVLMKCRLENIEPLRDIIRNADNCDNGFRDRFSLMIGISDKELRDMLRNDNKIKSFGFIDEDGDYDSSLNECIEEQNIEPYFNNLLKPMDCSNAYELDSFSVKNESIEICLDLLKGKNPVSILFYGKPGSGKTELAKALGKNTDKKIYIFKNEAENQECNLLGRLVCLLSMERRDSILIVDEADSVLKTLDFTFFGPVPTKTKGTVNKMLENNMDKVIYIINHQQQIDESTLRRFNFSIKFESMPATMLRSIAKSKLEPMNINESTKSLLLDMLDKYHLTGASVDNIVKAIEGMDCKDETLLLKKANIVMKENSLLLNGKSKMRETVNPEYDPKVLNTSMNPLKIVEMVQNAAKFAEKNKGTESGIRMLFYGLSGTGKTELARYIAEKLGKQILLKRASDIFGMYVGQNEKNIRNAFAEAEATDSILLFDEADSFFEDRNKAQHSWERSTVNEFLTQMEEFSGILICTTNLRNIMDPAMQRRFHMMVEFKPMKFEGIKIMAERYFPAYHLSNRQIEELEDTNSVTPGDFGALSSRIRFINPDEIDSDYILAELKKLQKEKKNQWKAENGESERKIGFVV